MAITYRIYSNDGSGGPVDYSTPVASTTGLTYVTGSLTPSTDHTFAVRAFDPVTSLEEANTDARVRVVIDAGGQDVTGRPNAPHALHLSPVVSGGCRVSWAYFPAGSSGIPTGFHVYLTPGLAAEYSTPAATVAYAPGQVGYSCNLPGPYTLSAYTAAVRSFNAVGSDTNTDTVTDTVGLPTDPFVMDSIDVRTV